MEWSKLLTAVGNGRSVAELKLSARESQDLPETVAGLFTAAERDGTALRNTGPVLLIECRDADVAERMVTDSMTRNLCQRAGALNISW